MSTPHGILHHLTEIINEKYGSATIPYTDSSDEDREIAEKMLELIHGLHRRCMSIEEVTGLALNDLIACDIDPKDEEYQEDSDDCLEVGRDSFTLDYMKKAVKFYANEGWKSLQKNCRRVKHRNYIHRFKKYIDQNGTRRYKQNSTDTFVYEKFTEALQKREILHDYDLKKLGIEGARGVGLTSFKASSSWTSRFKKKYNIVSRKINKFVTRISDEDSASLLAKAEEFTKNIRSIRDNYSDTHVLNSDQSGFNYILKSSRMHTICGEKTVTAHTESNFKQTHSYTIQPLLALSGDIVGKLFIVMQEKGDSFGPRVQAEIDELLLTCRNVVVKCSRSGKMCKDLVKDWVELCVKPIINEKCLLLIDGWKGQKSEDLFEELEEPGCDRRYIPDNTTPLCQPWDVYGFRQWKNIARKFSSHCWLFNYVIDIGSRYNIIKMQSLVMNQLSAPIFKSMWKYSWWKSGYTEERPGSFENTNVVMFPVTMNQCECCERLNFVRCAHCRKYFCFEHFFIEFHYHDDNDMSQCEDN